MRARTLHILALLAGTATLIPSTAVASPKRPIASWSENAGPQVVWRYRVWMDGQSLYSEGSRNDKEAYRESVPLAAIACLTDDSAIRVYSSRRGGVSTIDLYTGKTYRSDYMSLVAKDASTLQRVLAALEAANPIVRAKLHACSGGADLYHLRFIDPSANAIPITAWSVEVGPFSERWDVRADRTMLFVTEETPNEIDTMEMPLVEIGCVKRLSKRLPGIGIYPKTSQGVLMKVRETGKVEMQSEITLRAANPQQAQEIWSALKTESAFSASLDSPLCSVL